MSKFVRLSKGNIVKAQNHIPYLVRELRERVDLTQEKLAAKLGVTAPTINRWENGRAKPSPLAMKQLKSMLDDLGKPGRDLIKKYLTQEGNQHG